MTTPQAITTRYAGHRFRSRTEARWAMFLDSVGRAWEYEQQGYQMVDGTRYLPDFYLPELRLFMEVKGRMTGNDEKKILSFVRAESRPLAVVSGIPHPEDDGPHFHLIGKPHGSETVAIFEAVWINSVRGVRTEQHGVPTYITPGKPIPSNAWEFKSSPVHRVHPLVDDSYRVARMARFEHGEEPRCVRLHNSDPIGTWVFTWGSDMSHYFVSEAPDSLCGNASWEGHGERGDDPLTRCWVCEAHKNKRDSVNRSEERYTA